MGCKRYDPFSIKSEKASGVRCNKGFSHLSSRTVWQFHISCGPHQPACLGKARKCAHVHKHTYSTDCVCAPTKHTCYSSKPTQSRSRGMHTRVEAHWPNDTVTQPGVTTAESCENKMKAHGHRCPETRRPLYKHIKHIEAQACIFVDTHMRARTHTHTHVCKERHRVKGRQVRKDRHLGPHTDKYSACACDAQRQSPPPPPPPPPPPHMQLAEASLPLINYI